MIPPSVIAALKVFSLHAVTAQSRSEPLAQLDPLLASDHHRPSSDPLLEAVNVGMGMPESAGNKEGIICKIGINRDVHNNRRVGQTDQAEELWDSYFIRGSHSMHPFLWKTCEHPAGASRGVRRRNPMSD